MDLKKAIHKSQHCQRNWNLAETIPQEDIDLILESVTQCPSKQNLQFYNIHVIQDRKIIEELHDATKGFGITRDLITTNSQTLANLVIVFEAANRDQNILSHARGYDILNFEKDQILELSLQSVKRDEHMAVGVAAGYANLTATLMGYSTGCCACFKPTEVTEMLGLENECLLIMGIGIPGDKNRRVHHLHDDIVFPTRKKQKISIINH